MGQRASKLRPPAMILSRSDHSAAKLPRSGFVQRVVQALRGVPGCRSAHPWSAWRLVLFQPCGKLVQERREVVAQRQIRQPDVARLPRHESLPIAHDLVAMVSKKGV